MPGSNVVSMADRKIFRQEGLLPVTGSSQFDADRLRLAAEVFAVSQEGIVITDARHGIVDVNPAFTRITGHGRGEVIGKTPALMKSGRHGAVFYDAMKAALRNEGAWRGEIWNRRKCGEIFPASLSISAVVDAAGKARNYVGIFSDISRIKQHLAELDQFAHYDTLTGLPNRRLLADRMAQARSRARRQGKLLGVCYLDLDGFKPVNDEYGHEVGDALLVQVARALQRTLRADDTLARLGGDEFVLLYNDLEHEEECCQALDRVLAAVSALTEVDGRPVAVSASVGVTFFPRDDAGADALLRHADQCMYWAKGAGKSRYHIYDPELDVQIAARQQEQQLVADALERREFVLHFQPKINLVNREVIGAEGLIRWQHPQRGLLLPGDFLPTLANTQLAIALGEWVIEEALRQMSEWHAAGLRMKVSVNVSPDHLRQPDFAQRLRAMLERHPAVPPDSLELEILESASIGEAEHAARTLAECLALGVQFSLDDFGTGSSSLTYLRRLLVQSVKIDHSFVRDMLDDPQDRGIVDGVIRMSHALDHKVIAEGVESARHGEALIKLGCHFGQGYGIARPMPATDLPGWVGDWRAQSTGA
jgi:diguanylate cyclase (GGDEF)-like protein/PAS domain S-box-containing protein